MSADCRRCLPQPDALRRGAARAPARLALASTIVAALLPKCPMCLMAYLSVFGVSLGATSLTLTVLRPLVLAIAAVAVALTLLRWRRPEAALRP
jgi:hypothetical protein